MAQPLRFGVVHDFRSPPGSPVGLVDIYAQTLEQVELIDQLGLDLVWFTEHHFLEDGHLPNFVPVAGAVAARTKRVRISTDICLAPFTHPLRLGLDLAVLDNLSGHGAGSGVGLRGPRIQGLRHPAVPPGVPHRGDHRDPAPGLAG